MSTVFFGAGLTKKSLRIAIRRHHAPKQCLFVEDMLEAKSMFVDGYLQGPFTGMHVIEGLKIVVVYSDGKLLLVHTMTRRSKTGSDITRFFFHSDVLPKTIPHTKRITYIFGVLALPVDVRTEICMQGNFNSIRGERTLTRLHSVPTELFKFFPNSTTAIKKSFVDEFVPTMHSFGIEVPSIPESVYLDAHYPNQTASIYTVPQLSKLTPKNGYIEYNENFYKWGGYIILLDDPKRWEYSCHQKSLYSGHSFMIRYSTECKMTIVESIRRFRTRQNSHVAVLSVATIKLNGWNISKTNLVAQRDLEKYNIEVGSQVMMTVKASGSPHLVLPPEMEKYNVYSA